jgi:hypothetical protein
MAPGVVAKETLDAWELKMETRSRFTRLIVAVLFTALLGAAFMAVAPTQSYADGFPVIPPNGTPDDTTTTPTSSTTTSPDNTTATATPEESTSYDAATLFETLVIISSTII